MLVVREGCAHHLQPIEVLPVIGRQEFPFTVSHQTADHDGVPVLWKLWSYVSKELEKNYITKQNQLSMRTVNLEHPVSSNCKPMHTKIVLLFQSYIHAVSRPGFSILRARATRPQLECREPLLGTPRGIP